MPKNYIKKLVPKPEKLKEMKSLQFLGSILHEPNLWHINRHSVSKAFLVGIFCCFLPMPFQMVVAAVIAVWINSNLPISVALVWISNPITIPPMFYFNYLVGAYILRMPAMSFEFQLSFSWLSEKIYEIGVPLLFGSLVMGLSLSVIAYVIVEFLWRRKIRSDWAKRKALRMARTSVAGGAEG